MSVKSYIGKIYYRCAMCHNTEQSDKYKWIGELTKTELIICYNCAKREIGGKSWPKKSQRLKKSKQK